MSWTRTLRRSGLLPLGRHSPPYFALAHDFLPDCSAAVGVGVETETLAGALALDDPQEPVLGPLAVPHDLVKAAARLEYSHLASFDGHGQFGDDLAEVVRATNRQRARPGRARRVSEGWIGLAQINRSSLGRLWAGAVLSWTRTSDWSWRAVSAST